MKYKLHWNSEDEEEGEGEGVLVFFENKNKNEKEETEWLCLDVFVLGEEAELVIKTGIIVDKLEQSDVVCGKLVNKLKDCIWKAFSLLWKKGIEEVFLVEKQDAKVTQILKEANIIETVYSEYMMKRTFSTEEFSKNSFVPIEIIAEEDGFICENKEKSFFCRLLPYQEEHSFYLYEVEVQEMMRNRGIATNCLTQLFSELVKRSGTNAAVTIYLQVGSYNKPAVHLYQKLGFELSEEICYNVIREE